MEYIAKEMPGIFNGSLVISEGGGFPVSLRGRNYMLCASGEKGICRVKLYCEGTAGHSSCPPENQAAVSLAEALHRLTTYCFERKYTTISKQFTLETGLNPNSSSVNDSTLSDLLQYMLYDGLIIDSIDVGQRINVIPQRAEAEIEYRILPGTTIDEIELILENSLEGINVKWEITAFETGYESSINSDIIKCFEQNIKNFGFDGQILPMVALGRTDGRFLGSNAANIYGFSPVLMQDNFTEVLKRVHNHNECIAKESYIFGARVMAKTLFDICLE
jgi:acetylornithine deacetylase/succinyl-diaminopimelate desuccinylase-like protein